MTIPWLSWRIWKQLLRLRRPFNLLAIKITWLANGIRTDSPQQAEDKKNWPIQRGFDRFYGTIHGFGFLDPNTLIQNNALISPTLTPRINQIHTIAPMQSLTMPSVLFVSTIDKTFFMYVAFTALTGQCMQRKS